MKTVLIIVLVITTLISGEKIISKKIERVPIPEHDKLMSVKKKN